jgi:hypothetical protein
MRRRLALTAATLTAFVPAATAHAGFTVGQPIDGPSADIVGSPDVDVARDGNGVVAYVRRDAGVDHIFVSRMVDGTFQAPERVDAGLDGPSGQPVAAAADGGRIAVAYVNAGVAYVVVKPAGSAWLAPQPLGEAASFPSVDMSINGAAYVTFTSAGDVRAARLDRTGTAFTVLPTPLDIDPAANAGSGVANRSRVAVSADGTGLAVWTENGHVFARRLFNGSVSAAPQDLNAAELDGHAGGVADTPVVDIEDDSSFAWVAFRQYFDDGGVQKSRAVARRLKGSRFEDGVFVDGLPWGAEGAAPPRLELSGRGEGIATVGTTVTGSVFGAILKDDIFNPGQALGGGGVAPQPVGTVAETTDRVAAWMAGGGSTGTPVDVHARFFDDDPARRTLPLPGADTVLSTPEGGAVDPSAGLDASGDRVGDSAIVFVQAGPDGRRLMGAWYDRPPGSFMTFTSAKWRKFAHPPVHWSTSQDLAGGVTYRLEIDGKPFGETRETTFTPPAVVPDGVHRWRVVATDRAGQSVATKTRTLRVDATPPTLSFKISRKGGVAKVTTKAADVIPPSGKASGIQTVRIDFGDRSAVVQAREATHRFGRKGRFTIRVSATDVAGNVTVVERKVRVK